jgi:hypothetical protein
MQAVGSIRRLVECDLRAAESSCSNSGQPLMLKGKEPGAVAPRIAADAPV